MKEHFAKEIFDPYDGMVRIPAGTFLMGYEGPDAYSDTQVHEVTISHDFWIGKYPVTKAFHSHITGEDDPDEQDQDLPYSCGPSDLDSPSPENAFFLKLNQLSEGKLPEGYEFRLPTEAEWEYACRGGNPGNGKYFFECPEIAVADKELEKYAWPLDFISKEVHPVGLKQPNGFGLYDMIGNTYEACCDTYPNTAVSPEEKEIDPLRIVAREHRVVRGKDCAFRADVWFARNACIGMRLVIAPKRDLTPQKTEEQRQAESLRAETRSKLVRFYPGRDIDALLGSKTQHQLEEEKDLALFADKVISEKYPFEKALYCRENGMDLVSMSLCVFFLSLADEAAAAWEKKLKQIAYIPLTPLGDVICCMNQLEHLKKFYTPCRITVFAIPLIAGLMRNSVWVDEVVVLNGGVHGDLDLTGFVPPETEFDAVFNIAYHPGYIDLQKKLKCKLRYGSECCLITKEMCEANFDKWVSQEYWDNVTLKKYRTVCEQMAEPIRLVDPDFNFVYPTLTPETYHLEPCKEKLPEKFVLFLPGTSWIGKYWPITKYLAVAKTLKDAGVDAVFAIGPQDRRLVPDLEANGCFVLDTLPFAQLGYVINKAELIIGNDSGPMHFAAAFHRKTIHIIASGSAFNWYPYEEPIHSLIMPSCACEEKCNACQKTCIGHVSVESVVHRLFDKLSLPQPRIREVAFLMQDRIGDSIVNIDAIEEVAKIYAPCRITVFSSGIMKPFFEAYGFADQVVEFKEQATVLPNVKYDAVFNYRYDTASLELLREMEYDSAYGYEQIDFPEAVCKEVFTKYLPLTLWDDVQLRRYSSVTEQGAALIRLVEPEYHCNAIRLDVNTFCIDYAEAGEYMEREMVLIVPGASSKYKDWGVENYLHLAADLKNKGRKPLFVLGPQEESLYREAAENAGFKVAVNLPLTVIAALAFYRSEQNLAIGNDTGVMHLIRACNCRSVTICFEDTHLTWAPYANDRHSVVHADCADYESCRQCKTRDCRKDLTYERVFDAG